MSAGDAVEGGQSVARTYAGAPNGPGRSRMRLGRLSSPLIFDDGRQADCLARREDPGTGMRACSYHASPGGARLAPCV